MELTGLLAPQDEGRQIREIIALAGETRGIALSERQARELLAARCEALKAYGRAEFGGGITPRLIKTFGGSPYIAEGDFVQTVCALTELFYEYKTRTELADGRLLDFMSAAFDGECRGELSLLEGALAELEKRLNGAGEMLR